MSTFVHHPALDTCWYPVAESEDIDTGALALTLLAKTYVLWRSSEGSLVAAPDRCPHREAPLSAGEVKDGVLTCPYHGWSFGDGGTCVSVPSSGPGATVPPTAHLPSVTVEERYGLVWMCPGEPANPLPEMKWDSDPSFRRINTGIESWSVSTPRMVDNFMDISHFPWVHTGTFGGAQDPTVPKVELVQLDADFFGYAYEVDAANPDEANTISGSTEPVVHRHMSSGFHLPFIVRSTISYEDGLEHILLLCSTPVDDTNSLFTFVVWRNDDFSTDPQEIVQFDRAIGAEDKAMLEQIPGTLPLGRLGLVSVQSDKPSVEWRRRFAELIGFDE
jgi:phenylpropionate dioxygenase-like ring-hydroxylating dioxygenase large terminal subunit